MAIRHTTRTEKEKASAERAGIQEKRSVYDELITDGRRQATELKRISSAETNEFVE